MPIERLQLTSVSVAGQPTLTVSSLPPPSTVVVAPYADPGADTPPSSDPMRQRRSRPGSECACADGPTDRPPMEPSAGVWPAFTATPVNWPWNCKATAPVKASGQQAVLGATARYSVQRRTHLHLWRRP